MAETSIMTAQYVRISQPAASIGDRMIAQIIDWLVMAAYEAMVIWGMVDSGLADRLTWLFILLMLLPLAFYSLLCELLNNGQSIGKMVMKTRVVAADGSMPTMGALMLRWLLWIVDGPSMSFAGLLAMVFTENHQRLGDLAAGTVVIKLQDYKKIQVSLDEYDYLQHGYVPRYPQAADLSLEQIEIIRRTLSTPIAEQAQRISTLAEKVQGKLSVTPQEPSPLLFLQRIVRDYQYYALEEI